MATQRAKSGLAGKLGAKGRESFDQHKSDDTTFGIGGLPGGIVSGIAQVVDCKFDVYKQGDNEGEYFFYAAAVVVSPNSVKTKDGEVRVKGQRTSIMEPMCDTVSKSGKGRQSVDEHLQWVLNEMRKLGVETSELGFDDLESTAAAIKESGVYTKFSTRQSAATVEYPDPKVWEEWKGVITDYIPSEEDAVEDETQEESPKPTKPVVKPQTKAVTKPATKPTAKKAPEPEPEEAEDDIPFDLDQLGEAADGGDTAAQATLAGQAKLFNIDSDSADNWTAVAEALKEAGSPAGEEAASDEETEWVPEKGQVYLYKPAGAKKPVECEVLAVFPDKNSLNLKNLDDGKTQYKGVKWGDLIQE